MNDRIRILDTDILSLWERHPEQIEHYLVSFPPEQQATTIITAEEQLRGRLAAIKRAKDTEGFITAYGYLRKTLESLNKINILPFNKAAAIEFVNLRSQKIRIGVQDLRIAAIVLSVNGVLVTRNLRDFSQVPDLIIEDWTKENEHDTWH
jgi:tRNA(fMet)-specific endonuclease VapC